MARTRKTGVDYFPFDVSFFFDLRNVRLQSEFGGNGVLIYEFILCLIYKNGYYISFDEDLIPGICHQFKLSEEEVASVINYLIDRSVFDKALAENEKILTSKEIQMQYQEIKRRSKSCGLTCEYWLLSREETMSFINSNENQDDEKEENISSENSGENQDNSGNIPEESELFTLKKSKGKERKIKKSKVKESKGNKKNAPDPTDPTEGSDGLTEDIQAVIAAYKNNFPAFPDVEGVYGKRLDIIRESLDKLGADKIIKAFEKAGQSNFLAGKNKSGWTPDFDWFIRPDTLCAMLEGKYDDWQPPENEEKLTFRGFDIEDLEKLANNF